MVNILPMVKMYLSSFCKLSIYLGSELRILQVRPHPFYLPNCPLNYHKYQLNWALTIKKLSLGGLFEKFIFLLGLIFATNEFVEFSMDREYRPWRSRASEAQRPKGRGFPVRYFPYYIVPLNSALKGGAYGAIAGRLDALPCLSREDKKDGEPHLMIQSCQKKFFSQDQRL